MDIIQLIQEDHTEVRRLFAMIDQIEAKQSDALDAVWHRLSTLLHTHAAAEEKYFYPEVLKLGTGEADADSAKEETLDAVKDHNEIRDACKAVDEEATGSAAWFAAVKTANEKNGDHLAEEERQALTDFRKHASLELRHELALKFIAFELKNLEGVRPVDKDPRGYVKENS